MDFLNSIAVPWDKPVEWLSDGADLVDWLEQARALPAEVAAQFRAENDTFHALDAVADEARGLREWWRDFATRHAGRPLTAKAIVELEPLNRLLARDDLYHLVESAHATDSKDIGAHSHGLRRRQERRWTMPERLLQPIAEAISDFICEGDFSLVRTCEGPVCTVMFYDRTKGRARRWCSMAVCGNRAKAAAHRARLRDEQKGKR